MSYNAIKSRQYYLAHRGQKLEYARLRYLTPEGKEVARRARRAYFERTILRRAGVVKKLGGKCFICGFRKRLELHHLYYVIGKVKHAGWNAWRRNVKEAELHPERFRLLCHHCHKIVTIFRRRKLAWANLVQVVDFKHV